MCVFTDLVGPEVLATVAAVVAESPGTVDEGLLAQPDQLTRLKEQGSLQRSNLEMGVINR